MNVRDIYVQHAGVQNAGGGFKNNSLLAIGKKGQVVEGVISGVSGQISISFNGVEVALPHGTVQNATEGEKRKFQIMDVSKENIVLKEVGNSAVRSEVRGMVNTSVANPVYRGTATAGSAEVAQTQSKAGENLAVLTGADYKQLEESEGDFEKRSEEYVDKAVSRLKEQKQQNADNMDESIRVGMELKEELENAQDKAFLSEKSMGELRDLLAKNNLPTDEETINRVYSALRMYQNSVNVSDNTMAYIVGHDMLPTIENIYHGQFSGSEAVSSLYIDNDVWNELLPQIEKIIEDYNLPDASIDDAKWLFANDLPVTVANLEKMAVLHQVQDGMEVEQVLRQIMYAMNGGSSPEKASLDVSQIVFAREAIQQFASVTDSDIHAAALLIGNGKAVTEDMSLAVLMQAKAQDMQGEYSETPANTNADTGQVNQTVSIPSVVPVSGNELSDEQLLEIQTKRQVAEICLKMTVQSVQKMSQIGIRIDTAPLQQIVDSLRDMENNYYKAIIGNAAEAISEEELDLLHETLQKTADIASAPAEIIGGNVRQQQLLTFNELHSAAVSATYERQQFLETYESVATRVDSAYGDSIDKAFGSISHLLAEIGMENTEANQRAVRILGYNSMEITPENIVAVKMFDSSLNRVIDNMKPSVVLDMIRQGENPLELTVPQLEQQTDDLLDKQDTSSEEKYSRFLWQLERQGGISEEEREGYIGIYRLLNNIQKTDGAAIGSVLKTDREVTLGNLLQAVRTMKLSGIDALVDDDFGGLMELQYKSKPITEQIAIGFAAQERAETTYYSSLVDDVIDEISPAKLSEVSEGNIDSFLGTSVEMLAENLKKASGNPVLENDYYEQKASEIRETVAGGKEAREYLDSMQIPVTIENLSAAEQMIQNGYQPLRKFYDKKEILNDAEKEEFTEIFEGFIDALGSEEEMSAQCDRADIFMEGILERSYSASNIDSAGLKELKLLSNCLHLNHILNERRNYEVPVQIGDNFTMMNVMIIHENEGQGKVQIKMENPVDGFGSVAVDVQLRDGKMIALMLSDHRQGLDLLKEKEGSLREDLAYAGYDNANISYGFDNHITSDFKTRTRNAKELDGSSDTDTSSLYRVAKILVKHIGNISFEAATV